MKIKAKILKELLDSSVGDEVEGGYKLIEEGQWIDDGKYSYLEGHIFQYQDKFYSINDSRSGSYHTDYYYGSEDWEDSDEEIEEGSDFFEVEKVEVTITKWKNVK